MSTEKQIKEILTEYCDVEADKIDGDTRLEDFGCDSLDIVEVAMEIEERFDIDIPDEVVANWTTVQELFDYVEGVVN